MCLERQHTIVDFIPVILQVEVVPRNVIAGDVPSSKGITTTLGESALAMLQEIMQDSCNN